MNGSSPESAIAEEVLAGDDVRGDETEESDGGDDNNDDEKKEWGAGDT